MSLKVRDETFGQKSNRPRPLSPVHPNGSAVEIKSTDNLVVNVILNQPLQEPLPGWIEVRGTGQGKCHVIAQHLVPLPDEIMAKFDPDLFDDVLTIINTCNNPWVNG